jgi:2-keto-4-pentenoate hydratase/2-oxohepta-3-ene-1,7-dioic acid hydratase in catechol pathway
VLSEKEADVESYRTRLVRVRTGAKPVWGVVDDERVYELPHSPFERRHQLPTGAWEPGPEVGPVAEVDLLAPVTPSKIVCVGRNYPAHAAEHDSPVPVEPLLFLKPPSAVVGPGEPIHLPRQSDRVEHEAELAIVIGRRCRNVPPEEAWTFALGITAANDVTARDLQRRDGQWTRAKGFDTFCPVGPWVVTGVSEHELADLEVACRVNGDVRQMGQAGEMVFSPAVLIAYAASVMTLEPGDLILTGTPAGVGPLQPGDLVEVEVGGVGILPNPVRG